MSARLMAGDGDKRRQHDYYPTNPGAVIQFLKKARWIWGANTTFLEPACGEGHIVKVL